MTSTQNRDAVVKLVTEGALMRRINRLLRQDNEQVRKPRSPQLRESLGDLYLWHWSTNLPGECFIDLEEFGRRMGVLRPDERVAA